MFNLSKGFFPRGGHRPWDRATCGSSKLLLDRQGAPNGLLGGGPAAFVICIYHNDIENFRLSSSVDSTCIRESAAGGSLPALGLFIVPVPWAMPALRAPCQAP